MKKIISLFLTFLFSSLFLFSQTVFAGTTSNVTATVTAQNISVSVADGSIAFGTIGLSSTKDTTTSGVNDSQTATNNGNITENLNINAAATGSWTLAATAGANQYTMKFCTATCDTTPSWTSIATDYVTLATGVAATSGTAVFDLQVGTPTSSVSYSEQTITVTVQAVAP